MREPASKRDFAQLRTGAAPPDWPQGSRAMPTITVSSGVTSTGLVIAGGTILDVLSAC